MTTLTERPRTAPPPGDSVPAPPPRLAEGVDLIGEYEGSGLKEPHYVARRGDGQVVQLSAPLYLVSRECGGRRDEAAIGEAVTGAFGRAVSADNVRFLVDKKLRPLGILADRDGRSPEVAKPDPLLALKFRVALVPETGGRLLT